MSIAELLGSLEIGLIYALVAIGIYLTFRVIDFPDLSCDGSFVTGAATAAASIDAGFNPAFSLILGLLMGGCAGFITGILHIFCRVSNLLSGILTAFMLYSINLKIMGGVPNISVDSGKSIFTWIHPLGLLLSVVIAIVMAISLLLITDFGLALRSLGLNKKLALFNGFRLPLLTMITLIVSNALIGLGGALFSQHQFFADVSQGTGTIIIGLAAIMIGEKILPFHSMWIRILSCVVGSIIYRIVVALALHSEFLNLNSSDLNLITSIIVVIIMLLPRYQPLKVRHA